LFKTQLTFRPTEEHQIYLQVAEGYRAGGVNATIVSSIPPSYDSDRTLNVELGAKTSWLDGRLFANLSIYQVDWDNVQFEASYTQQFNALVNCSEESDGVRADGFELEIQAQATDNLDLGINYTSIDASWQVDSADCLTAEGLAATFEPPGQLQGDSLIGVPDYSGSAYAQYELTSAPFGADSGFVRFDVMYQSRVKVNDDNLDDNLPNPSYVLANLNAGLDFGNYAINVFVRNIADEAANLSLFQGLQQNNRVTPAQPRTIGASVTFDFGE
jgi:iron complex outermembrane receptor protein